MTVKASLGYMMPCIVYCIIKYLELRYTLPTLNSQLTLNSKL